MNRRVQDYNDLAGVPLPPWRDKRGLADYEAIEAARRAKEILDREKSQAKLRAKQEYMTAGIYNPGPDNFEGLLI